MDPLLLRGKRAGRPLRGTRKGVSQVSKDAGIVIRDGLIDLYYKGVWVVCEKRELEWASAPRERKLECNKQGCHTTVDTVDVYVYGGTSVWVVEVCA